MTRPQPSRSAVDELADAIAVIRMRGRDHPEIGVEAARLLSPVLLAAIRREIADAKREDGK